MGLVAGTTAPTEVGELRAASRLPFLLPGIGTQGGDLEASLGQLVGDGQPADSATEHHHARRQAAGRRLA